MDICPPPAGRTSATTSFAQWSRALDQGPEHRVVPVTFAPEMKMTSHASSISRIEPDAAEVLRARLIAATEVEWHSRVQWSTLLVPRAPRTIRMKR
jgi:hypothetical protein